MDDSEKCINDQAVELLVQTDCLERNSAPHGVLKQYLEEGIESLTPKQKYIFEQHVRVFFEGKCFVCGEILSLDEFTSELGESQKMCGYHRYQCSKDD